MTTEHTEPTPGRPYARLYDRLNGPDHNPQPPPSTVLRAAGAAGLPGPCHQAKPSCRIRKPGAYRR